MSSLNPDEIQKLSWKEYLEKASRKPAPPRPSWEEYFMKIAFEIASRSSCSRRKIGAVLVKGRRILSTGYNGPPAGLAIARDVGCLRDTLGIPSGELPEICRGVHAEQNAIVLAAREGIQTANTTLYCTHYPCIVCQKLILNAGISCVKYCYDYPSIRIIFEEAEQNGLLTVEQFVPSFKKDAMRGHQNA